MITYIICTQVRDVYHKNLSSVTTGLSCYSVIVISVVVSNIAVLIIGGIIGSLITLSVVKKQGCQKPAPGSTSFGPVYEEAVQGQPGNINLQNIDTGENVAYGAVSQH